MDSMHVVTVPQWITKKIVEQNVHDGIIGMKNTLTNICCDFLLGEYTFINDINYCTLHLIIF